MVRSALISAAMVVTGLSFREFHRVHGGGIHTPLRILIEAGVDPLAGLTEKGLAHEHVTSILATRQSNTGT